MSFASIEIALALDEDYTKSFLDGKMRFTVEDDTVCVHVDKKNRDEPYILAECSLHEFRRMMEMLGVIDAKEPSNDD